MAFILIASIFLTLILGLFTIPLLKRLILDYPNIRSSHKSAKPTSGGIIFIIPICLLSILCKDYSPLYCLPLALVGLIDDRFNLNSIFRYSTQILTVSLLFLKSNQSISFFSVNSGFLNILILLFIGTAIINFINFMDGLDGIVAGTMFVTFFMLYVKNNDITCIIAASSLLSFLIFNWSPAKVFMGDVGSTFIAALFISKLINIDDLSNIYISTIPLCPFWFDCIICLIRRLLAGQNIFKAHKFHLYQRLNQAGWTHSRVSLVYICSTFCLYLISFFNNLLISSLSGLILLCLGFIIDQKFAKPFNYKVR
tara:strand:- start:20826 stop:21758 length:933 start_codon:yes stop_codon:yes gene_type:complete